MPIKVAEVIISVIARTMNSPMMSTSLKVDSNIVKRYFNIFVMAFRIG